MGRVLQCCPACARQHDVSAREDGSAVRCSCGGRFGVRVPSARAPRAMCCSRCGGNLKRDALACEYCQAEITLEERRLDSICPSCFARMASDACFCMSCGIRIEVQAQAALPSQARCPRCSGELRERRVGTETLVECSACAGLWLDPKLFERLCEDAGARQSVAESLGALAPRAQSSPAASRAYIPCPVCKEPMNRRNFGSISGVLLDVCKDHGLWLDHGELEKALAFAERGGLVEARRRELTDLERRKQRAADDSLPAGPQLLLDDPPRRRHGGGLLGWLVRGLLG